MERNLLEYLTDRQTVSVIAGDPKVGKSAFLTALLYSNVFLDVELPKGPAVWFCGEEYPPHRRFLTQSVPHERKVFEYNGVPNLTPGYLEAFLADIGQPRYIVIDSLDAFACLQPNAMRYPLNQSLDLLHQVAVHTNASVIALNASSKCGPHHIFENLGVNVCAYHSEYGHFGQFITLSLKRNGRMLTEPILIHSKRLGHYELGGEIRACILRILSSGALSVVELARALGITPIQLHRPIQRLQQDGRLIVIGKQGRSDILARPDFFALETAKPMPKLSLDLSEC